MASGVRKWSPQQEVYRKLCKAIVLAYGHDHSQLFWARHNVKVEMYKYHPETSSKDVETLLNCGAQCAIFISEYMAPSAERIVAHNRAVSFLALHEAKTYHEEYMKREEDHYVWCRQRLRGILSHRPNPPYPY
ncbi:acetylpolyamine aminohydrolase [Perkinsela sp. CCAP 1560/4]|nr:acetylpolyamine aminohydrolase [Perkinsela sp. CCAP 1560/4]|eukprot:KNH04698.1 acetylpolyamine aminohydrolase [Perkinsela sp. CCAP 1560/4]